MTGPTTDPDAKDAGLAECRARLVDVCMSGTILVRGRFYYANYYQDGRVTVRDNNGIPCKPECKAWGIARKLTPRLA